MGPNYEYGWLSGYLKTASDFKYQIEYDKLLSHLNSLAKYAGVNAEDDSRA